MSFMIFDTTGNAIDSFEDLAQAQAALTDLVRQDRSMARELALLTFDDAGHAIGEAEVAADLADAADLASEIDVSAPFVWIPLGARTLMGRWQDLQFGSVEPLNVAAACAPPPAAA